MSDSCKWMLRGSEFQTVRVNTRKEHKPKWTLALSNW